MNNYQLRLVILNRLLKTTDRTATVQDITDTIDPKLGAALAVRHKANPYAKIDSLMEMVDLWLKNRPKS